MEEAKQAIKSLIPVNKVLATCVLNPFDPLAEGSRVSKLYDSGLSIRQMMDDIASVDPDGYEVVVSINGSVVEENYLDLCPSSGMSVVFAAVPKGGGGGGNKALRAVLTIAVMVAVTVVSYGTLGPAAAGMMGITENIGILAVSSAIAATLNMAASCLINALLPLNTPDLVGTSADTEKSATYGWGNTSNIQSEGSALPVLFGTVRITPPLIGKYVETIHNSQYLNLLYAIADHSVDSISNILINNNPAEIYSGVTVDTRLGEINQSVIPYFNNTRTDVSVGHKVSTEWSTHRTTGNAVDGLLVGIVCPNGLYYANDNGGLDATSVSLDIEYKKVGDLSWSNAGVITLSNATNSAVRYTKPVSNLPAGQYDVRVKFHAAPGSGVRYSNNTYFEYLEEIVYDDFTYPGTSLLAVRALATDQLSGGMPTITCLAAKSTVPVWTGEAYENKPATNPAWASYHLLHNVYLGNIPHSKIIYSDFLAWANWCDEKGYTVNIYLDQFYSLRKSLDMVSIQGRATVVQVGSKWTCIVDKPEDLPVQRFMFTMGNIIKDSFQEEFLSMDDRATEIEITYFDADLDYSRQTVTIQSNEFDGATDEVRSISIVLYGCTNRNQAIKYGKYLLNRNRYLTLIASWDADVDAIACMPGQVVEISHDVPQWGYSGRIISATSSTVTLDQSVIIEEGNTYQITIQHIDDDSRETLTVTNAAGSHTILNLSSSWAKTPAQYTQYAFGKKDQVTKLMRVLKISRSQEFRYKITALEYVDEIYNDDATISAPESISDLVAVSNLNATEIWKPAVNGAGNTVASLTWQGAALKWHVFWRINGSLSWNYDGYTTWPSYEVKGLAGNESYDFCVTATGAILDGKTTTLAYAGVPGVKVDIPAGLTASIVGQQIKLTWDASSDIRVKGYTIKLNGTPIAINVQGTSYLYSAALTTGLYNFTLCAVDEFLQESDPTAAASITVLAPNAPSPSYGLSRNICTVSWADCKTSIPINHYEVNGVNIGNVLSYSENVNWTGEKEYVVKAVDVAGNESLTGSVSVTISSVLAVTNIAATGLTHAVRLALTFNTFDNFDTVEIWSATVNNRNNAVKVGESAAALWTHSGLNLIDTRYYWARIRDIYGNYSVWHPESPTAGVSGSASQSPDDYLTILEGKITDTQLSTELNGRLNWIDTEEFLYEPGIIEPEIYNGLNGAFCGLSAVQADHAVDISDLQESALSAANAISVIQSEIAELTTTEWSNTGSYIIGRYVVYNSVVYRCIQAYDYPTVKTPGVDTDYWEEADALSTIVSEIETRVDDLEAEIVTKASTTTVNSLDNRVTAAESTISQHSDDILLRVTETEFSAFSELIIPAFSSSNTYIENDFVRYNDITYRCIQTIDFSPAPIPTDTDYWEECSFSDTFTSIQNDIEVNTEGISLISTAITGPVTFLEADNIYEDAIYVQDAEDVAGLDVRVTQAGIDINGIEADINLHTSLIDVLGSRLSQAEVDIDGAEAAISLKASQVDLDATNAELTAAELVIDGHTASIAAKASQAELNDLTSRVSVAESDILAGEAGTWASISNKLATATYNTDQRDANSYLRVAALENRFSVYDTDNAGIWDSETTYYPGEIIIKDGNYYRCIKESLDNTPPNATYWIAISSGLLSQWTLKLNTNNHIAGVGLMLDGEGNSEFEILADRFAVVNPDNEGDGVKYPFIVGDVDGVSTVGINGDLIVDGTILTRHIATETITADMFVSTLYGDLNQAMNYVKTILSMGDEYEQVVTSSHMEGSTKSNIDGDAHASHGLSIRLATSTSWDAGTWDTGTWDIPTESLGIWTTGSVDLGASKTLQVSLEYKLLEDDPLATSYTIEAVYSHDGSSWGTNSPSLDNGEWETLTIKQLTGNIYRASGNLFSFRYFKIRATLTTSDANKRIILYSMYFKGNIVNAYGYFAEQAIATDGTVFLLNGYHSAPAVTVTPVGATPLAPLVTEISNESVTIKLFSLEGVSVGGVANITIIGV